MTRRQRSENGRGRQAKPLWVYSYEIVLRRGEHRLDQIEALLEREHAQAQRGARRWNGRVVHGVQTTHILIVSDSPDQHGEVNRRLEDQFKVGKAMFSLTLPMAVVSTTV